MKRFAWLLLIFAAPLSSPMACGGDGCLRNSDCSGDRTCSAGQCVLLHPRASASGGEGGDGESVDVGGSTSLAGKPTSAGNAGKGGSAAGSSGGGGESNAGSSHGGDSSQAGASAGDGDGGAR